MSFAKEIVCARCDKRFGLSQLLNLCPCGSPLLVRYDLQKAKRDFGQSSLEGRVVSLWRYRELLPLQNDAYRVSLGEGCTPLLEAKKLGRELGLRRLWIKDEAQNPTGSFKDRGLSLAISRAKELGVTKAAIPSAGNAGGSFAAYAARDFLMLQAIRESGGTALSVGDDEMLAEIPRVGKAEGVFFCPEGAACVAALRRLVASGWIKPADEVLIFNTASGLKYLDVIQTKFHAI